MKQILAFALTFAALMLVLVYFVVRLMRMDDPERSIIVCVVGGGAIIWGTWDLIRKHRRLSKSAEEESEEMLRKRFDELGLGKPDNNEPHKG